MSSPFTYTNLTYTEIYNKVVDKLTADPRFANFTESDLAQSIVEIFSGVGDFLTYYMDRRAEECYLDTAKLKSSAILLSRNLGYVPSRKIPAEAQILLVINDITGISVGDKITMPIYSKFTYLDYNYVLKYGFTRTWTEADNTSFATDGYVAFNVDDYNTPITVVEGEMKERVIRGINNIQVNQPFQTYKIEDTGFSNRYGSEDYFTPITRVWVGEGDSANAKIDANEFVIDRRSLVNWQKFSSVSNTALKLCLIRSTPDENTELLFGDDTFAKKGARTTVDNIYIQYLSTNGGSGNLTGIIGSQVNYSDSIKKGTSPINSQVEFRFNSNVVGGSDFETMDSIKNNAPGIYYSLDRLVTKKDYITYLKSLTTPIDIINSVAWGEQEEARSRGINAIPELFNVVFFTCIGSLYNVNGDASTDTFTAKTIGVDLDSAILDDDFKEYNLTNQSYFNLFIKSYETGVPFVVEQLTSYDSVNSSTSATFMQVTGGYEVDAQLQTLLNGKTSFDINVSYVSTNAGQAQNVVRTDKITIDGIDYSPTVAGQDVTSQKTYISGLIQTGLRAMLDLRGDAGDNTNFSATCYPNVTVTCVEYPSGPHNSQHFRFVIKNAITDPCFIVGLSPVVDGDDTLSNLGLYGADVSYDFKYQDLTGNAISTGIVDTVNTLNEKSQITVKNIYVTPNLHDFNLEGTVKLNKLVDSTEYERTINNAIYVWLDDNNDFDLSVNISDIYKIIRAYDGVVYSNIKFTGDVPALPYDEDGVVLPSFWMGTDDYRVQGEFAPFATVITNSINSTLNSIIGGSEVTSDSIKAPTYAGSLAYYTNSVTKYPGFDEKFFYTKMVRDIITAIQTSGNTNATAFINSTNFDSIIGSIHSDFIKIIRQNMIDSDGNISKYSLPNEIVKITSKLNYEYV